MEDQWLMLIELVQKKLISPSKNEVVTIFTDVTIFDNGYKYRSAYQLKLLSNVHFKTKRCIIINIAGFTANCAKDACHQSQTTPICFMHIKTCRY